MTKTPSNPNPAPEMAVNRPLLARVLSDRQFVCALVLLVATAIVWPMATSALKWTMLKIPVPWPAGVTVSPDFRLTSLPTVLGKYHRLEQDGFFVDKQGKPAVDGQPDGEVIAEKEIRVQLGAGTPEDAPRLSQRASNWYLSRIYVDPSQPEHSPLRFWRLDVTYYTGAADKVPHVPGRCEIAGGAVPQGEQSLSWPQAAATAWRSADCVRARFTRDNVAGESVEYYTFSLNGLNESSWKKVRLHLSTSPWEKYCYFAKIQFGPLQNVPDVAACDQAARAFFAAVLPEVLKNLPSSDAIQKFNKSR